MEKAGSDKENPQTASRIPRLRVDDLERIVDSIVRGLRSGKPAHLPGLGTINPGNEWTFLPEASAQPAARAGVVRDYEKR